MTRISVIIPTFDRGDIFDECIQSVLESISPLDEIIVVNDSKKQTLQLKVEDKRIHVFENPKSGVASARNLGASHAQGEYLLFIDDDMIINSHAIESCYQLILEKPDTAINADWIYVPEELQKSRSKSFGRYLERIEFTSLKGWCTNLQWITNGTVQAKGITSQFLVIQRSIFEKISGYNEAFHFAGFEDYDLGKRLENIGLTFLINTQCLIYHNEKDRMEIIPFLERKKRGAFTRKEAVMLGYPELKIPYSKLQWFYYSTLSFLSPLIVFVVKRIPNSKSWDRLYTHLMNRLTGIYIFDGYNGKR